MPLVRHCCLAPIKKNNPLYKYICEPNLGRKGLYNLLGVRSTNYKSRKILDLKWFPSVFRPGFHSIRPDSHWFLEQFIPFDISNQRTRVKENSQKDLSSGRFGDWRRAPLTWECYHPDHDDYQKKGKCRRWTARCLNIGTRTRLLTEDRLACL